MCKDSCGKWAGDLLLAKEGEMPPSVLLLQGRQRATQGFPLSGLCTLHCSIFLMAA